MSEPYIRINQFFANSSGPGQKSVLGHANYSFFDANGVYKGTYGSNLKSDDGRPSGVRREDEDNARRIQMGSPYAEKRLKLTQVDFNNALDFAKTAHNESVKGNLKYALACGNCVDFGIQIFDKTQHGRRQFPNYLQPNTGLYAYSYASNLICSGDSFQMKEMNKVLLTPDKWRNERLPSWAKPCTDAEVPTKYCGKSNDSWDVIKAVTTELGTCEAPVKKYVVQRLTICSPIVINLDGKGIQTTSIFDQSVKFDLLGTGQKVTTAWITPSSGFLVWNQDGVDEVNSVADLFGGIDRMEGFLKLMDLDKTHKGYISQENEIYPSLRVWVDKSMNGRLESGELFTLPELGIEKLFVNFDIVDITDDNENLIGERSHAVINGIEHEMSEVYFKYNY
ncbi:hypothetical protein ACP179_02565 [Xenorhabdus stockiae]|uniref:hypothetical protein n=1 Tax=Xenorhabdus stockiae TaxID=351614 RepID=UPI003CE714DF